MCSKYKENTKTHTHFKISPNQFKISPNKYRFGRELFFELISYLSPSGYRSSRQHTEADAAELCQCTPKYLAHGALAGKPEGRCADKPRTIYVGTVCHVNPCIKRNQKYH